MSQTIRGRGKEKRTGITSFPIPSAGIIPNLRVVRLIAAAIFYSICQVYRYSVVIRVTLGYD
jgi:hypothetical protein